MGGNRREMKEGGRTPRLSPAGDCRPEGSSRQSTCCRGRVDLAGKGLGAAGDGWPRCTCVQRAASGHQAIVPPTVGVGRACQRLQTPSPLSTLLSACRLSWGLPGTPGFPPRPVPKWLVGAGGRQPSPPGPAGLPRVEVTRGQPAHGSGSFDEVL